MLTQPNTRWRGKPLSRGERGRGEGIGRFSRTANAIRREFEQDPVEVAADFLDREANDPNAKPLEDLSSPDVIAGKPLVLLAVELHDKFRRIAIEVHDVVIKGNLPPELGALEA
jgi:hypothetical protein